MYFIWRKSPRVWRKGGEAHSPSFLKSSVKFPQSVMIWGAMSSAGAGPLCFLKTNVTAPVYQEMLEHFMLFSADQLFKDADFIFQQDLAPAHTAKSTKSWLNDHGVGVLDRPANSPDLNPIENPNVSSNAAAEQVQLFFKMHFVIIIHVRSQEKVCCIYLEILLIIVG